MCHAPFEGRFQLGKKLCFSLSYGAGKEGSTRFTKAGRGPAMPVGEIGEFAYTGWLTE